MSEISSLNAGPAFSSKGLYGSRYRITVSYRDGSSYDFAHIVNYIVITGNIYETVKGHYYKTAYKTDDVDGYLSLMMTLEKYFE